MLTVYGFRLSIRRPTQTSDMISRIIKTSIRITERWSCLRRCSIRLMPWDLRLSWTWWSIILPMSISGLRRAGRERTIPTATIISGEINRITGTHYSKEKPGNMMRREASTISISLQRSSLILIWTIQRCVKK